MKRELIVDSTRIHSESDCYVIAEIGHNHQGSLQMAKELFRAAKECGVNAVRLQKRDNRMLYTRELYNKPYDHENSFGTTYGEHREALEFGKEEYQELQHVAREMEITLFATAFDWFIRNNINKSFIFREIKRYIVIIRIISRMMVISRMGANPQIEIFTEQVLMLFNVRNYLSK